MIECPRIDTLISNRHIIRVQGKLRWADGGFIKREPEETWVNAIERRIREEADRTGEATAKVFYMAIEREESDADSESQAVLGWTGVTTLVGDVQAYGAERTQKISKTARVGSQKNIPNGPQKVEQLPATRRLVRPVGKKVTIQADPGRDGRENAVDFRNTPVLTPVDTAPANFDGIHDSEFVPMMIDQTFHEEKLDEGRKAPPKESHKAPRNIGQGGAERVQKEVIERILETPLTLRLRDIMLLSREVLRGLTGSLKATQLMECLEEAEKKLAGSGKSEHAQKSADERNDHGRKRREASKDAKALRMDGIIEETRVQRPRATLVDAPTVDTTIGNLKVRAVVDTGSMANMISAARAEETGLPTSPVTMEALKIYGISGPGVRCDTWIPEATIYITKGMKPTQGTLFVVEEASFDVILGMPWMKDNLGAVVQKDRGSYVQWISDLVQYEVRSYQAEMGRRKDKRREERARKINDEESSETPITSCMARIKGYPPTDGSCIPDSEEEREKQDLQEQEAPSGDEDLDKSVVKWTESKVAEWRRKWEQTEEDADDEEKGMSAPPPNQLAQKTKGKEEHQEEHSRRRSKKRKRTARSESDIIEVTEEMEEEYTKTGTEGDGWASFMARESKRRAKRNDQWLKWLESSEGEKSGTKGGESSSISLSDKESEEEEEGNTQNIPVSTRRMTNTLTTASEMTSPFLKPAKTARPPLTSKETTVRRTQRVRIEKKVWEPEPTVRKYQNRSRTSKTTTNRRKVAKSSDLENGPKVRAFCVSIRKGGESDDQEERTREKATTGQRQRSELREARGRTSADPGLEKQEDQQRERVSNLRVSPSEDTTDETEMPKAIGINLQRIWETAVITRRPETTTAEHLHWVRDISGKGRDDDNIRHGQEAQSMARTSMQVVSHRRPRNENGLTEEWRRQIEEAGTGAEEDSTRPHQKGKGKAPDKGTKIGYWRADAPAIRWIDPSDPQEGTSQRCQEGLIYFSDACIYKIWQENDTNEGRIDFSRYFRDPDEMDDHLEGIMRERRGERFVGEMAKDGVMEVRGYVAAARTDGVEDQTVERARNEGANLGKVARARMVTAGGASNSPKNEVIDEKDYVNGSAPGKGDQKGEKEKPIRARKQEKKRSCLPSWSRLRRQYRKTQRNLVKQPPTLYIVPLTVISAVFWILSLLRRPPPATEMMINTTAPRVEHPLLPHYSDYRPQVPLFSIPHGMSDPALPGHEKEFLKLLTQPRPENMINALVAIKHLVYFDLASSPRAHDYYGKGAAVSIRYPDGIVREFRGDVHLRLFPRDTTTEWGNEPYPSRRDVSALREIAFEEPGTEGILDCLQQGQEATMERIRAGPAGRVQPFPNDPGLRETDAEMEERKEEEESKESGESEKENREEQSGYKIGPPVATKGQRGKRTVPLPKVPAELYQTEEEDEEEEGSFTHLGKDAMDSDESDIASSRAQSPHKERQGEKEKGKSEGGTLPCHELTKEDVVFLRGMKTAVLRTKCDQALFDALRAQAGQDLTGVESASRGREEENGRTNTARQPIYRPESPIHRQLIGPIYIPKTPADIAIEDLRKEIAKMKIEAKMREDEAVALTEWTETQINTLDGKVGDLEKAGKETLVGPIRGGGKGKKGQGRGRHQLTVTLATFMKVEERVDELEGRAKKAEEKSLDGAETKEKMEKMERGVEKLRKENEEDSQRLTELEARLHGVRLRKEPIGSEEKPESEIFDGGQITRVSGLEHKARVAAYRTDTLEQYIAWNEKVLEALWKTINTSTPSERYLQAENLRSTWRAAMENYNGRRMTVIPSRITSQTNPGTQSQNPFINSFSNPATSAANSYPSPSTTNDPRMTF